MDVTATGRDQLIAELQARTAELQRTQQQAEEMAARLRHSYCAGKMWSWQVNPATRVLTRQFELSEGPLTPNERQETLESWYSRIHSQDRDRVRSAIDQSISKGGEYEAEFRFLWSDGAYHWVYARGSMIDGPEGRVLTGVAMDNTERHRAQESLRYLGMIVESSEDAIIGKQLDGTITSWNRAAERMYGYSAAEVIGQPISILVAGQQHDDVLELMQRAAAGERIERYETMRRRKDGALIDVSLSLSPIRDDFGAIIGIATIAHDHTARKRAEEDLWYSRRLLEESEVRFRVTFEQAAVGIANVALDGRWLHVNQRLCDIVGYTPEELLRLRFHDITHSEDVAKDAALYADLQAGRIGQYSIEKRYIAKNGTPVWVNLSVGMVRDREGKPQYAVSVVEDITERKRLQQDLLESEQRLRLLIEHAPVALAMFDCDMRYLYASDRWRSDYDLGRRELAGLSHYDVFPDIPDRWKEAHRRGLAGEVVRAEADQVQLADGSTQWVRWELRPWRDAAGAIAGIVIFTEDITQQKQAEDALRRSEERFRSLYANAAVGIEQVALDGTLLTVNAALLRMLGYSEPELLARTFEEITHPDDRAAEAALLDSMWRGERESYEIEKRYLRADGAPLWVHIASSLVRDEHGEPSYRITVVQDISGRMQSEQAQRESEATLRTVFDSIYDAIVLHTLDGSLLDVNERCLAMYGISREDLPRITVRDLSSPDNPLDQLDAMWAKVMAGEPQLFEWKARRPRDGSEFDVEVYLRRVSVRGRDVVLANVRDITERKQATRALRESEERFRNLADNISQFAWMTDATGFIFWYNRRWYEYTGTTLDEMQGWGWQKVHHPDHVQRVTEKFKQSVASGEGWEDTFPLRGRDGNYRWFLSRALPIRDEQGRVVRWFGTNTDVTQQREALQALGESEARFRALAENIPQLVWSTNSNAECDYVSERWLKFTGTTLEQNLGRGWRDVIHPEDRENTYEAWVNAVATGGEFEVEYRLRNLEGEYEWHLARGVRFETAAGERWFGTSTNIEELKRTQEVLMRSEKLASVGRMAATIAHEINNPLEAVMNAVYLAWSDKSLSEQARAQLDLAERELERVAHITRQTLGFYKESGKPVPTDLCELVSEVVNLYAPRLNHKQIKVETRFRDCQVEAVPGEMRQVVSNLLANSIDAITTGGRLLLRISRLPATVRGDRAVRITVADTGSGIAREHARRIFEPFFTTKLSVGTGLGLWVTREIVKKHGGSIRFRSRVGKGTVISIAIPEMERRAGPEVA